MRFLPKTVDSQFLVRVIRNEVGPEEREFFEQWLEESEENKEEFSSSLLLWDKFQYSHLPSLPPQQEQWEKIEATIANTDQSCPDSVVLSFPEYNKPQSPKIYSLKSKNRQVHISWLYRIAALLIIGFTLFFLNNSLEKTSPVAEVKEVKPGCKHKILHTFNSKGRKSHTFFIGWLGNPVERREQINLS
jgi:hypothetical protein